MHLITFRRQFRFRSSEFLSLFPRLLAVGFALEPPRTALGLSNPVDSGSVEP